jgi:hypothetical protein
MIVIEVVGGDEQEKEELQRHLNHLNRRNSTEVHTLLEAARRRPVQLERYGLQYMK